ncbi:MAG TPA: PAAR domain-containing protein [Acidimicrobiales bacterium]|nr:PAAR domain-containing protein [Acidimicrobiales bacterium]
MGTPAAVMGDKIVGSCAIHQIPNPATGAPQPAPPMPFQAPLLQGLATKVLVNNKPAAVVGSSGYNTPPHVGLHPADPFMAPPMQVGRVMQGSPSVLIENKPAARQGSQSVMCNNLPGQLVASGTTVLIA